MSRRLVSSLKELGIDNLQTFETKLANPQGNPPVAFFRERAGVPRTPYPASVVVSATLASILTLVAVLSGLIALAYAAARGVPGRDWRPAVAALIAGFIAANAASIVRALGAIEAPVLSVVWAGGPAMLLCAMWHALAPRSWHVAWDAFVALGRRVHPLGSVVFLITLLVTLGLTVLRVLRTMGV